MEEINLNYKDEASLESGTGRATEERRVRGREEGDQLFLFLFFFWLVFSCFFFSFFPPHPVGMRWSVFLPLWLATQMPLLRLLMNGPLSN